MHNETNKKAKKQIPYWLALLIGIPASCFIGFILSILVPNGVFTPWESFSSPPSGAAQIIDADGFNVWVSANNGNVYLHRLCFQNGSCDEWTLVVNPTEITPFQCYPIERGQNCNSIGQYFSPGNPVNGQVIECISANACSMDGQYNAETFFALMEDGTVRYWYHGNGTLIMLFYFIGFTILLPIMIFVIISFVYLVIFLINKIRRRANTGST
jgi:hypothetical protein